MATTIDEQRSRAPARSTPGRRQRFLNAVVAAALRSPLHGITSNRLLLITVTGRKSGRSYTVPVGYVEDAGVLLIGTAAGWRKNLRPGVPVTIRLRGRDCLAQADVVTDEEGAARLYRSILHRNPIHGRFAGIGIAPDGGPDRADLRRALAHGAAVVRLRPVDRHHAAVEGGQR